MPEELDDERALLDEQIQYYRQRAPEYDAWFLREGPWNQGHEHKREWDSEVTELEEAIDRARPQGRILELACGTGLWTRRLAPLADHLTAVDASAEMLELNRKRVGLDRVEYVRSDIFSWKPTDTYDFIFFGFWLSHVPPSLFEDFWDLVATAIKSASSVFFLDSLFNHESIARVSNEGISEVRQLVDGRRFQIVKVFYDVASLEERLVTLRWRGYVRSTDRYFLYGRLDRAPEAETSSLE